MVILLIAHHRMMQRIQVQSGCAKPLINQHHLTCRRTKKCFSKQKISLLNLHHQDHRYFLVGTYRSSNIVSLVLCRHRRLPHREGAKRMSRQEVYNPSYGVAWNLLEMRNLSESFSASYIIVSHLLPWAVPSMMFIILWAIQEHEEKWDSQHKLENLKWMR